jgi:aminoglycoside/choline kinase family phosphotransferase
MDAPPDKEDCKPFIHVAGLLAKATLVHRASSTRISTTASWC